MKLYLFFNAVISVALAVPLLDSSIGSLEEDNIDYYGGDCWETGEFCDLVVPGDCCEGLLCCEDSSTSWPWDGLCKNVCSESERHIYVQVQNSEVVSGGNACCGDAATTVTVTVGCNATTEAPEAPSVYTTEEPIVPTEPTPQCPPIIIEVTVTVEIRDALDNHLVPAANVDVDGGAPAATDADGHATFGGLCAGGSFTITVSCDGYEDASVAYEITDSGDGTMQITISLSQTLPEGQLRMVLNWGPDPTDLDSHAIQLSGTYDELCHVYYSNKQCPLVSLDLDNTQGGNNGAETITWSGRDSNIYLLYIKDYAPNPNVPMVASSAIVNLYGNAPTVTIHIPTLDPNSPTASRYWILGSLDNNIGLSSFTMFNCLSSTEPQGYGGDGMAEVCDVVN
jgi:hypothetical protein